MAADDLDKEPLFDGLEHALDAGYQHEVRAPGESVRAAIERIHGARSDVALREPEEGGSPIALKRDDGVAVDDSRYLVLGEIARGGVGVVYRGRDKDLNRDVALKVLRADHAGNADVIQRFVEEAQVGGQLQHPGIVPIYGIGLQPDGRAYFAMKLIKGQTLSALLDSNRKNIDLLTVFEQVALTVAYAHSRGVIHRDLKPANVMVGAFGEVIVVDWGFAKVLGMEQAPRQAPETTVIATVRSGEEGSQSLAGSVMGTPAYMPPEQAMGHVDELDERSDVFALGAILCEIITGKPPYTGTMRDQLLASAQCRLDKAHERIDACDAPEAIKQIARDCLQPLGEDRPRDASVVAERLQDHFAAVEERARRAELEAVESEATASRARRQRKQTLVLAGIALVAFLGSGGGYLWWRTDRDASLDAAQRRVTAALGVAAEHERAGELIEAISAARKAVDVAETEQSGATEARATLVRLTRAQAAAEEADRIERANAALLAELEEIRARPSGETPYDMYDDLCTAAFERHAGPLEHGIARLKGTPYAAELASHFDYWRLQRVWAKRPGKPIAQLALAIDPDHETLRRAIYRRDPDAAVKAAAELGHDNIPPQMLSSLGSLLGRRKRQGEAIAVLRDALQRHPGHPVLNITLGYYYFRRRQFENGCRCYTAAIAARPGNRQIRHSYAIALESIGRYEDAVAVWRSTLERFPDWAHGTYHLGHVLGRMNRLEEATTVLERARELDPKDAAPLLNLALFNSSRRQWDVAEKRIRQAIALDPEYHLPWNHLGDVLRGSGRLEEAIAAYKKSIELGAIHADAWLDFAYVCEKQKKLNRAVEIVRAGVKAMPRSDQMWDRLGYYLGKTGDIEGGLKAHKRSVKINPRFATGWNNLAVSYAKLRRYDESLEARRRYLELNPKRARIWDYYGIGLMQWKKDNAGAAAAFQKAVDLEPNNAGYWERLGLTRYRLGEWDAALAARKKVVELRPENAEAWRRLGQSWVQRHAYKKAVTAFEKAQALEPKKQTGQFLKMAREFAAAAKRIEAGEEPNNAKEAVLMGEYCLTTRRYELALRYFKRTKPQGAGLFNPIRAAAHADLEQARTWMRAWLDWCKKNRGNPGVRNVLAYALQDEVLAPMHDTDLWRELEELAR
ncbi:MAG: protein kinase domain-containing protein [Planctomycetota bacterium]|jgi:serine/threonine-protein kinase